LRFRLTLAAALATAAPAETLAADPAPAPCAVTGISGDADPAGLRVHADPAIESRVVGVLLPAMDPEVFYHDDKATLADGLVGAQFTVTRVWRDWLRIADIDPVTDGIGPGGSLQPTQNFQGEGWVHASMVQLLSDGPPDARARPERKSRLVSGAGGIAITSKITGCRGNWAEVNDEGIKGWVPSLSNKARVVKIRAALMSHRESQ